MKYSSRKNQEGFATIMAVLIVGAIGVAVAIGFLTRGIEASKDSNSIQYAYQAKSLADQCAEIGLQKIRDSATYIGTGDSSNDAGTCTYSVSSLGGTRRNIDSVGTVQGLTKKVLVEIDGIFPKIIIIDWREVL